MDEETDWLADRFDEHRPHLRAVAYRMLGSWWGRRCGAGGPARLRRLDLGEV